MHEDMVRNAEEAMAFSAIDARDFCKATAIPPNGSIEKLAILHAAFEMLRHGRRNIDMKDAVARACHAIAGVTDGERDEADQLLSQWDRRKN